MPRLSRYVAIFCGDHAGQSLSVMIVSVESKVPNVTTLWAYLPAFAEVLHSGKSDSVASSTIQIPKHSRESSCGSIRVGCPWCARLRPYQNRVALGGRGGGSRRAPLCRPGMSAELFARLESGNSTWTSSASGLLSVGCGRICSCHCSVHACPEDLSSPLPCRAWEYTGRSRDQECSRGQESGQVSSSVVNWDRHGMW